MQSLSPALPLRRQAVSEQRLAGRTWVKRTGSSVIASLPAACRATVKRDVAKSPGAGKSARKWAPREFSRAFAARAITWLTSTSERRLSQSCHVRSKRRSPAGTPVASSSASMSASAAMPRSIPAASRITPISSHMVSISRSRKRLRSPGFWPNGMERADDLGVQHMLVRRARRRDCARSISAWCRRRCRRTRWNWRRRCRRAGWRHACRWRPRRRRTGPASSVAVSGSQTTPPMK